MMILTLTTHTLNVIFQMEYEWLKRVQKFKRIYENNQRWYTVMYGNYDNTLQGSKLEVKLVN